MLLVLTVALVMAVMVLTMAMPVFARAADPCTTGDTPSSPPDVGGAPATPPPTVPPGYMVRAPQDRPIDAHSPFTGCS
jgi:hypothetical protein